VGEINTKRELPDNSTLTTTPTFDDGWDSQWGFYNVPMGNIGTSVGVGEVPVKLSIGILVSSPHVWTSRSHLPMINSLPRRTRTHD